MRVTRGGQTLDARIWALIEDAKAAAKIPPGAARVVQGSWKNGSQSAGTHSRDGAFDLSVAGLSRESRLALVWELRKRNALAYLRSPEFGWPQPNNVHIHGIVADQPGLSAGARAQVVAYNLGRNALASRRKDPHPRPKRLPFVRPQDVVLKDLRYGKTNGSVRALQKRLGLHQDGVYGPATDRAVRDHQRNKELFPVDSPGKSFVGPEQAKMLGLG